MEPALGSVPVDVRESILVPPAANTAPDPLVPTIFHEPWWLDIVTRGTFQEATVSSGGRVVGRMPYAMRRHRLFNIAVMPDLTRVLGPAIDEGTGSVNTRRLRRLDVMRELAEQLPRCGQISIVCHRGVDDLLAFQATRFETFVHFTSEIAPRPEAELWSAMRDKTRNVIRRSEERVHVRDLDDPEEFAGFYARNLADAGQQSYFDLSLIRPIYEACRAHDTGRIICARNPAGALTAAVFCVWDRRSYWYFLSTRSREDRDNGTVSLLIWHAMRDAAARGLTFDFDAIASEGTARFYAGFGGQVMPRFSIQRSARSYALFKATMNFLRGARRNFFTAP